MALYVCHGADDGEEYLVRPSPSRKKYQQGEDIAPHHANLCGAKIRRRHDVGEALAGEERHQDKQYGDYDKKDKHLIFIAPYGFISCTHGTLASCGSGFMTSLAAICSIRPSVFIRPIRALL